MLTRSPRPKISLTRARMRRQRARDLPLRAELFGVEQLARHAQAIAAQHKLVAGRTSARLLTRLDQNEKVLRAFNRATLAVDRSRRVTPAAEWLLDNFYLIEEQIQMARRHLPREYSRELPRLANGPSAGVLRVYDIVLELISHVDAQIDAESLAAFVAAYQTVAPLKLGELWAVPIMLRLGLIENLARITSGLAQGRLDRDLANQWVERLQVMAAQNPSRIAFVVPDMARAGPPLSSAFVAEFCQRLSRLNPVLHLARGWLGQRALEEGFPVEQLIHQESQSQASDQVSVSHSISSLRLLSAIDWKEFVETLSLVEQTLRGEPADVYGDMDFATRDRYRHVVEILARNTARSEIEVASKAVELAQESAQQKGREDRTAHVGFYLIDKGLPRLKRASGARWRRKGFVERSIRKFPFTFYVGGIFLFTLLATLGFVHAAEARGVAGWRLGLCGITFSLGVSRRAARYLFPFPSASPLEREREPVDGLRTETRKADAVQRLSPRALRGMLRRGSGRPIDFARNQIRHHPRYRHAIAARVSPPTYRHNGASVEPAAIRSGARDRDGRLRPAATAGGCESADGGSFTLR